MTKKSVTKISTLIGWTDILDFGREAKKVRKRVWDFLDKLGVQSRIRSPDACLQEANE